MIGNVTPLTIEVNARGIATVRSQLGQVEGAVANVGKASGGLVRVMDGMGGGLRSGFGALGGMLGGIRRMATSLPGMIGMGFGAAGLVGLVKETANYEHGLLSMQLALRLTDDQAASLNSNLSDLAKQTGRSKTELLAAARAATDFGVPLDKAVKGMRDASLLSQIMGVSLESMAPAMGGMEQLTGGKLSSRQQAGLLYSAQEASHMPEGMLLDLIAKLGPQIAGIGGGGKGATGFLMANIAAVGQAYQGQPKLMAGAMRQLVDLITDPKNKAAFTKMGINTSDLAGAEGKLLEKFAAGDKETIKLIGGLSSFFTTLENTDGGMDRFNDVFAASTGDLTASTDAVSAAMDKMEKSSTVTWNQMIEEFKAPLMDVAHGVLQWFVENKDQIISSFKGLATKAADTANFIGDNWRTMLTAAVSAKLLPALAAFGPFGMALGLAGTAAGFLISAFLDQTARLNAAFADAYDMWNGLEPTGPNRPNLKPQEFASPEEEDKAYAAYAEQHGGNVPMTADVSSWWKTQSRGGARPPALPSDVGPGMPAPAAAPITVHVHTGGDHPHAEARQGARRRTVRTTTSGDGSDLEAAMGM